jgi:hypothetical protein
VVGVCGMNGEKQKCLQRFGGENCREEQLERTSCRWEDNIKVDLTEIGCEDMDQILLALNKGQWLFVVHIVI